MAGHKGTLDTFDQGHGGMADPFAQGQDGMGGTSPQVHEFPEDYDLEEEDEVDINRESMFFEDELATQANANKKRQSIQANAYTKDEDKLFFECWSDIGQDPKVSAEQKASTFWLRVHREYPERKKFTPYKIDSKRGWVSLLKRWRVIQQECNNFGATLESIEGRPVRASALRTWYTCVHLRLLCFLSIFPYAYLSVCQYAGMLFICRHLKLWKISRPNMGTSRSTSDIVGWSSIGTRSSGCNMPP